MNVWVIYLDKKLGEYLDAVPNNLLDRYLDVSGCDEKTISNLQTGTRISFFQSRASREDQKSRLRQFSRDFLGITFIACLLTNISKKTSKFFKLSINNIYIFSRNLKTRTRIFFYQSYVSRRE